MSYQVTARKWRPMVFDDVIGQTHISNTLRNALAANRLAHAFIFSGTRGCGKTTTARILARAVNCLSPKNFEPCNECEICKEIIDGRSMDVIEIDGASNRGVDEIRNLRESVRYTPSRGKKKVYIIDEVHMLTKEAFNALLKTLEEPPAHILFIFATTEIHKVPATILSRCQRYDFRRISIEEIMSRLRYIAEQERITIDEDALLIIAKKGDGSMRDAQSIFDQVISFCGTTIESVVVRNALSVVDTELFFRVADAVQSKNTKAALDIVDEVVRNGFDIKEFLVGLNEHFRNMLIAKTTGNVQLIEESEAFRKRFAHDAAQFSTNDILRLMKIVGDVESSIRYSAQPRFKLEVAVIQMTKMEQSIKIDELLTQIEELKKKLQSGNHTITAPQFVSNEIAPAVPSPKTFLVEERKIKYTAQPPPAVRIISPSTEIRVEEKISVAPVALSSVTITIGDVQQRWSALVEEVRKKKISVGTILAESSPLDISNGALRIACKDDFHFSTLLRNKDFLIETLNTLLQTRLRIEPIIATNQTSTQTASTLRQTTSNNAEEKSPPQRIPLDQEHPLIQTLYKEFGAERV